MAVKHVTNVDVSQPALDTAKRNVEHNNLDLNKVDFVKQDVFKLLRQYREEGKQFDTIVMDPPKFADNKAQLTGACRGYKDIKHDCYANIKNQAVHYLPSRALD